MERHNTNKFNARRRLLAGVIGFVCAMPTIAQGSKAGETNIGAADVPPPSAAAILSANYHSYKTEPNIAFTKKSNPVVELDYTMVDFNEPPNINQAKKSRIIKYLSRLVLDLTTGWVDVNINQIYPTPNMLAVYNTKISNGCLDEGKGLVSAKISDDNTDGLFPSGVIVVTKDNECPAEDLVEGTETVARASLPGASVDIYGPSFGSSAYYGKQSEYLGSEYMAHEILHNLGMTHYGELYNADGRNLNGVKLKKHNTIDSKWFIQIIEYANADRCNIMGYNQVYGSCKQKIAKLNTYQKYLLALNGYMSSNESTLMDMKTNYEVILRPGGDKFGIYYFDNTYEIAAGINATGLVLLPKSINKIASFELCFILDSGDLVSVGTPELPKKSKTNIVIGGLTVNVTNIGRKISASVVGVEQ